MDDPSSKKNAYIVKEKYVDTYSTDETDFQEVELYRYIPVPVYVDVYIPKPVSQMPPLKDGSEPVTVCLSDCPPHSSLSQKCLHLNTKIRKGEQ